ncbi:MAG: hypothetical protein K2X47_18200 [Bdellovibrionales bacterium]|nr:hypothetical protein [Bdellovibrionales bacterium]
MKFKILFFQILFLTSSATFNPSAYAQTDYRIEPAKDYVPLREFQGSYVAVEDPSREKKCNRFLRNERVDVVLDLTDRNDGIPGSDTRNLFSPKYKSLFLRYGNGHINFPLKLAIPSKGRESLSGIWVHESKRRALISGYLAPREIYSFSVSKRGLRPVVAGIDLFDYEVYVGQIIERSQDGQVLIVYGMDHALGKAGGFPKYPRIGFMLYPSPSLKRRAHEICVLRKIENGRPTHQF